MPAILVNDVSPVISYTATAGQTLFSVPFEFFAVQDIVVERAGVTLTYSPTPANSNQFSVIGANLEGGGSITLGSPGATLGDKIVIFRDVAIERLANYPETGPMAVRSLNAEQAKHIAMMQQLDRDITRSISVPIGEAAIDLPSAAERSEKILTFDAVGTPVTEFDINLLVGTLVTTGEIPAQRKEFTATASQTVFNFDYTAVPTYVSVFLNGVKLPSTDFTHVNATVTLLTPATVGDKVALEGFTSSAVLDSFNAAASAAEAATQAALATTNGAAQVALATTQANLATTNGAAQVALATTQANLATTNGAVQVALAETEADRAEQNAALYDRLIDEFPPLERVNAAVLSNAPLLVGYDTGFELDFRRPYAQVAATKINGAITFQAVDSVLTDTNFKAPTVTREDNSVGFPPQQLFLNSAAPVVGDSPTNLTVGQQYRITMVGSGSLTIIRPLTAGGASIGTVTEATPLIFTALDTRIRISAVTGVVTRIQLAHVNAEQRYLQSTTEARYGIAISKHPATGEMRLLVDPAAFQVVRLLTSAIPALGTEWLVYLELTTDAAVDGTKYFFGIDDGTNNNYFRLRSDGLVRELLGGVEQFNATLPTNYTAGQLFSFYLRAKANEIIFGSQGKPSGAAGTQIKNIFAPSRVFLGSWSNQVPPGQVFIRRFAILPVA